MSAQQDPISLLSEQFTQVLSENAELKESLADVRARLDHEDAGWRLLGEWASGEHLEGLDLDEVKQIIDLLEPRVVAGSLPKRAVDLHSGFVWGRGCFIEGTEKPKGQGRPSNIRNFYANRVNQESIFSDTAREELQKARFVTGNVIVTCNKKDKTVNRIPFKQITGLKVDPNFPENIIAYKRTWDTKDGSDDSKRSLWYYTARYEGTRQKSYDNGDGTRTPVAQNETIVDLRVNRQVGHVLGVGDGFAGLHWAEAYSQAMRWGMVVSESLAKILFKVTSKNKNTASSVGVKLGGFGGHGGTASLMEGQELSAVSTAGRGYDFGSNRSLAAMAAAGWNVANSDLLNDSSANGSSYGSAQALVPGNRNAMLLMQREWADFYKTIFEVVGLGRPRVTFEPFEAPDQYRAMQALKLGSDALSDEEYRRTVLDVLDIIGEASDVPEILKTRTALAKASVQQSAPDQGQSNGSGGGGQGANDQRSDTVSSSEALRREMANEEFLDRFEALVARMEEAQK